MNKSFTLIFGLTFVIASYLPTGSALAQITDSASKSYFYSNIDARLTVRTDSTVLVEEKLTFNFTGSYHNAWRNISLNKISAITDIAVIDADSLQPLVYNNDRLDKLNPSAWGQFTTWQSNGAQNVEWYFNLADTTHSWIISYVVHGAIIFSKNKDRLYWNVFTDYGVPVAQATARVVLPQSAPSAQVIAVAYTTTQPKTNGDYDANSGTAFFSANNFQPQEDFTVDMGWPKGLVSQQAFWQDWLGLNWGWLTSLLIIVITTGIIFIRWYQTEKKPIKDATIIPQYEPPQNLPPAMAEIVCKERLTDQGLAATVVDLARRGYLQISEDNSGWFNKLIPNSKNPLLSIKLIIYVAYIVVLMVTLYKLFGPAKPLRYFVVIFFIVALVNLFWRTLGGKWSNKQYILSKSPVPQNKQPLKSYEKEYLKIIFRRGDTFATRLVKRWSNTEKRSLYLSIQQLKKDILVETEADTLAYDTTPSQENKAYVIGFSIIFIVGFLLYILPFNEHRQLTIALGTFIISISLLWLVIKFEARLNKTGQILKTDWLGFKMYLATAERYRLQNLTPQTFEKFLPYAMIFGIEKKWAQAFNNMTLPQPGWYTGSAGTGGFNTGGGFSAAAFSASFSSSFTSAFASSGGGGGGAGGGGAGGGGGGGGGGAG